MCIDKIPEVAKTKVSKPKRYYLSKLRLSKLRRPHMSTSRCGNICIRRGFSNCSSVDEDAFRNHYDCLQQNSNAFYGRPFREPRRGGNSDFAMMHVCFVISLSIWY